VLGVRLSQFSKYADTGRFVERPVDLSDSERLPATWAMPKYDFDEALGILALGNNFGELALCDYVNQPSVDLWGIMSDFSLHEATEKSHLFKVCFFPITIARKADSPWCSGSGTTGCSIHRILAPSTR
jgi:hypothetical protein